MTAKQPQHMNCLHQEDSRALPFLVRSPRRDQHCSSCLLQTFLPEIRASRLHGHRQMAVHYRLVSVRTSASPTPSVTVSATRRATTTLVAGTWKIVIRSATWQQGASTLRRPMGHATLAASVLDAIMTTAAAGAATSCSHRMVTPPTAPMMTLTTRILWKPAGCSASGRARQATTLGSASR